MNGWIYPRLAPRDVTVVICTFERPEHVRRSLLSLAMQTGLPEGFEVVVTDDGSRDETADVVAEFARSANFPIAWTSHPHDGFQVAKTRNDGVRLARGRYLLLLDGDCIVPPDHLAQHLAFRRPGLVASGDCCRFDAEASHCITDAVIASGEYLDWAPPAEIKRLRRRHLRATLYSFIGHPRKPALIGNNVGCWRADYERVNGYDENYREWGCEDDDFGLRLRWAGCRVRSILGRTRAYHLWHPPHPSMPARWRDCKNTEYFLSRPRKARCENGFHRENVPAASALALDTQTAYGHAVRT
jgi:glycosyltransferase involved in cell wall biosynthesis